MTEPLRIGVYGGTFDPVHHAHIEAARAARDVAELDLVLFVVAALPPHKRDGVYAPVEDRLAMVHAALEAEPGMVASSVEIKRRGVSYTIDTLDILHAQHPGAELLLIVGQDSLIDLPTWRDLPGILRHARLLVVPRPGTHAAVPQELAGRYRMVPFKETPLSSTTLRAQLAAGEDVSALLPPAVERYVREKGLYDVR